MTRYKVLGIFTLGILLFFSCKESNKQNCQVSQNGVNLFLTEVVFDFPRVRDLAISPDGTEMMLSAESIRQNFAVIIALEKNDGCWNDPKVVPFSGSYRDIEPHYSQDGKKLYFASNRPMPGDSLASGDYNIYFSERTELGWNAEVSSLDSTINTEANEFFPSIATSGNLYFTAQYDSCQGMEDIYFSRWNGNEYETSECLEGVNSPYYEFNAFVDPNESYIIYTSYGRPDGLGGGDLYISFNNKDGTWTQGKNLGEGINSINLDFCPFVDPVEGILYFTSDRTTVKEYYTQPLDIDKVKAAFNAETRGVGRLYTSPFNPNNYR